MFDKEFTVSNMSDKNSMDSSLELKPHRPSSLLSGRPNRGDPTIYKGGFWEPPPDYRYQSETRIDEDQLTVEMETSSDSNKYKSFRKLISRFAEKTSMQGVPYINNARLWYAKLIWTFLLVVAIGWMSFHLFYLIAQFRLWPIQTKIKLSFSNLEMPAVTICNVNPIRTSAIGQASQQLQDLVNYVDPDNFIDSRESEEEDGDQFVPKPTEFSFVAETSTDFTSAVTHIPIGVNGSDNDITGSNNVMNGSSNVMNGSNNVMNGSDNGIKIDENLDIAGPDQPKNVTNSPADRTAGGGRPNRRTTTRPSQGSETGDIGLPTKDQLTVEMETSSDSNKYKSFRKLISRFAEKTSMQGVPYINNARLWYAKLIWTFLLVVAIGWMSFHLFYLIAQFRLWPIQTKIKLSFSNLEMPAVTICNVNPIRTSAIGQASQQLQDLVNYVDPDNFIDSRESEEEDGDQFVPKPTEFSFVAETSTDFTSAVTHIPIGVNGSDNDITGSNNVMNGSSNVMNGSNNVMNGSDNGIKIDENLDIAGPDQPKNVTNSPADRTAGGGRPNRRTTTRPSQGSETGDIGLPTKNRQKRFVDDFDNDKIDEYIDYDEDEFKEKHEPPRPPRDPVANLEDTIRNLYFKESRKTRVEMGHRIKDMLISCSFDGYECFPHNFTLYQTPEFGNCYTIQSSTFTSKIPGPKHGLSIILFMENSEYIPGLTQGYGARVTINDQSTFPFPADEGFFVSSAFETHIGLKQINIERLGHPYGQCNDGEEFEQLYGIKFRVEILSQSTVLQNVTPCRSHKELQCQFEIEKEFQDKTRTCECDNPCTEKEWLRSMSTRQWPTKSYTMTLLRGLCQRRPKQCADIIAKADDRQISLNFLKIVVYYQDLNHEEINEDPEIETAQFASDVGGAIGLWIGLSILSVFEVVQLVVELCQYGLYKVRHLGSIDEAVSKLSSMENKHHEQTPDALNFNQPHFAKEHLYNGRFATARYQY